MVQKIWAGPSPTDISRGWTAAILKEHADLIIKVRPFLGRRNLRLHKCSARDGRLSSTNFPTHYPSKPLPSAAATLASRVSLQAAPREREGCPACSTPCNLLRRHESGVAEHAKGHAAVRADDQVGDAAVVEGNPKPPFGRKL